MELLADYPEDGEAAAPGQPVLQPDVLVRPEVGVPQYADPLAKVIPYNPKADAIFAPVMGPIDPNSRDPLLANRNTLTGIVEPLEINHFSFEEQFHTFNNRRYAVDPATGVGLVGDMSAIQKYGASSVYDRTGKAGKEERPKRKVRNDDPSSSDFLGPWAPFQPPPQAPIIKPEGYIEAPPQDAPAAAEEATEKEKKEEKKEKKEKEKKEEKAKAEGGKPRKRGRRWEEEEGERPKELEARSILHIPQERVRDYLGRSWIQAPSELKPREHECFLPKKQVLVWSGHTRGVAAIRFFPTTGHLLLSAGLDNKICLWDTHGYLGRGLVRTYLGHSLAVKDICFTNDGRRFISASYDRTIRLWDTETGQCISTFSNNKLPYCARLHPDKQNEFLAGCKDNRIYQWDITSGKMVLEYNEHLGAINTVTYIDENRRFVSSSDDKALRIWEYGIPVTIKLIAEPHMHSMPVVITDPKGKYFMCQSMDNQIVTYSQRERFKIHLNKVYRGHITAGYPCGLGISPDGHWLMSGDSGGQIWFWDFKTKRIMKTLKGHSSAVVGCEWHPIETSKVATCAWDGKIVYWD